jgi:hypothetical protein
MKHIEKSFALFLLIHLSVGVSVKAQLAVGIDNNAIQIQSGKGTYSFSPSFTVLYNATDPDMMMKPVNIKTVSYNVLTWKVKDSSKADFVQKTIGKETAGDGFDDRILRKAAEKRTGAIHNVGESTSLTAKGLRQAGDTTFFDFPANTKFILKAFEVFPEMLTEDILFRPVTPQKVEGSRLRRFRVSGLQPRLYL